jgi:hypothetical protein
MVVEDLYDLIETSTLENEYHGGLRPVIPWEKPSEEELAAWRKRKLVSSIEKYDEKKDSSRTVPFSIEWFLQLEIGLYLFSVFIKDTANDYVRINFCEEVYRFKKNSSRRGLRRAMIIVKNFLTSPEKYPKTNCVRIPQPEDINEYPTEINEIDLARVRPATPALTSEQLKAAMENNMDYPTCSESIVGLKGSHLEEVVKKIQELEGKNEQYPPPQEAPAENGTAKKILEKADDVESCDAGSGSTLFDVIECIVLESLRRDYWDAFVASPQYKRLLDFLWYQDRRVVPDDFFPMRVLGRGGFGLVKGGFFVIVC